MGNEHRPSQLGPIDEQIHSIETEWDTVCDDAGLTVVDRMRLRQAAVLHPSAMYDY